MNLIMICYYKDGSDLLHKKHGLEFHQKQQFSLVNSSIQWDITRKRFQGCQRTGVTLKLRVLSLL